MELEFENTGEACENYVIRRDWDALGKRTKEVISVKNNGRYSKFLTDNWVMFVESILPSALSSFYFFDGEKIAELAVDETNCQMKESIRAMLGITVLDVLKSDLRRNMRATGKRVEGKETSEEVERLRADKEGAAKLIEEADVQISKIEEQVSGIQKQIERLKEQYEATGGLALEQRQELIKRKVEKQVELDQIESLLIESAASSLPLYLVRSLLTEMKLQAEDEYNDEIMKQAISQLKLLLDEYRNKKKIDYAANEEFLSFVERRVSEDSVEEIYTLSGQALFQISRLLENELDDTQKNVKDLLKQKMNVKEDLDKIGSYLSLDINESDITGIYKKIKLMEEKLVKKKVDLKITQEKRNLLNLDFTRKMNIFNKCVEEYLRNVEVLDNIDRKLKYSNMALQIIDCYTHALQEQKTDMLAKTITECYKKLSNKKNLIQTIIMDSKTLDIIYLDLDNKVVDKDSLSAGEKQLMVVSILWALAICSKKKLPVIIDTPLSRLDSLHRGSLVTTYFAKASEQTIILSTDSEIDHNYYEMMKNDVGDEFTLVYDEATNSTTIKKGYFIDDSKTN